MKLTHPVVIVLVLAVSAFAQDVRYNFAAGTDYGKYRTYQWVQVKNTDQPDQLTDQQVKGAIDEELAKKGMTKVEGNADLLIAYQVSIGTEKQITMFDSGWGYGPGWGSGWYGGGGGMSTGQTSTISIGQVDLDMYDAGQKSLVWRGTASKTLDTRAKPEKRLKNLRKGAAKLLKNYPPVQKTS